MPEYIEKGKIEKFIEDGLNNPDKNKAFGHDAIEIMAEIHYMPSEDVAPVIHAEWLSFLDGERIMPERYYRCSKCGRVERRREPYCHCGAKMC